MHQHKQFYHLNCKWIYWNVHLKDPGALLHSPNSSLLPLLIFQKHDLNDQLFLKIWFPSASASPEHTLLFLLHSNTRGRQQIPEPTECSANLNLAYVSPTQQENLQGPEGLTGASARTAAVCTPSHLDPLAVTVAATRRLRKGMGKSRRERRR